jgi:hypothetical protein
VILRAEHSYGDGGRLQYELAPLDTPLAFGAEALLADLNRRPRREEPTKTSRMKALVAYVNHSRWIVDCPDCNSAQVASPSDPRFFCAECANVAVDGAWRRVVFPDDVDTLEQALDARREPATRNWLPHETVDELHAETEAMQEPRPVLAPRTMKSLR